MDNLSPFFAPHGVVVVGASQEPTKLGYAMARNLVQSGYQGAIHFVNPKGGVLFERPVYTRLADVPDPVDLAVLLVPAAAMPATLRDCGARGIPAAILASGGFREVGAEGATLEAECLALAQQYGMRLVGPNCVGLLNTHLPLDVTFLPPPSPTPGHIALISHSGAFCVIVIDWARGQGFGFSHLISLGNQADVNETDVLEPVAADPDTHVITLYLEGVGNGRRFIETARRVGAHKPLIALKAGRFASGQRAAASHTGALAGQENAYAAAFRKAGIVRANTSEELFDWARALASGRLPGGRAVAVLSNAGGPGVTAADAIEANGLHLAELSPATRQALGQMLHPAASTRNPVDMLAGATAEHYAASLRILLADPGVDSALVIVPPPPTYPAAAVAQALIPVIDSQPKPVVVALMGDTLIQAAAQLLRAANVPEYRFPERAAAALAALVQRAEGLARAELDSVIPPLVGLDSATARARLAGRPPLTPELAGLLLADYGIPVLQPVLAHSAAEAAELALQAGFPAAIKVASPEIAHKSDVGGVLLNLPDAAAVAEGYAQIVANARRARPQATLLGVHVQRMAPSGQDVIIGAVQDPQFGPLVMFGSGGVEVEGLKDVAFALAPLTPTEADELLAATWAGRKLRGYRNLPPADLVAAREALLRLGQLMTDFPEIAELEVNPLRVLTQGVLALDVRGRLAAG
jgi:acetyltransferase